MSLGWGRNAPQSLSARAGSWQQLQSYSAASLAISGAGKGRPQECLTTTGTYPGAAMAESLAATQARVGVEVLGQQSALSPELCFQL